MNKCLKEVQKTKELVGKGAVWSVALMSAARAKCLAIVKIPSSSVVALVCPMMDPQASWEEANG